MFNPIAAPEASAHIPHSADLYSLNRFDPFICCNVHLMNFIIVQAYIILQVIIINIAILSICGDFLALLVCPPRVGPWQGDSHIIKFLFSILRNGYKLSRGEVDHHSRHNHPQTQQPCLGGNGNDHPSHTHCNVQLGDKRNQTKIK